MVTCKAEDCEVEIRGRRIYCSRSCRTKTTNKLYKDYGKTADTLRKNSRQRHKDRMCLTCGAVLGYDLRRNKFCGHACSAQYTNAHRRHSKETKQKIAESVRSHAATIGCKVKTLKPCIQCGQMTHNKTFCSRSCGAKNRSVFAKATKTTREQYKLECKFTFGIKDYPDRFDFGLVEQRGWYTAPNRGNNFCGVSRDHMVSISDGFKLGIPAEKIAHPANYKLVTQSENASKGTKSSITPEELYRRIEEWELLHGT